MRVYSRMMSSASTKTVLAICDGAHLLNEVLATVTPLILFLGGFYDPEYLDVAVCPQVQLTISSLAST